MPIHLLPPEVASQIAAGEVVERPASVVKELLENALDAGATFITVRVEEAGRRLIEIADNGSGIQAAELPLALERHATSKLQRAEDLFHIQTLGFRGEALASIGSVSRTIITSHPAEAEAAARLRVEGGRVGAVEPVGAPLGTTLRVEDLFYNVPARLKFLKSDTTEKRVITELVTRYALAYPTVRFHLFQDGRPALQTSGNGNRREVLAALWGVEEARQMLEVLSEAPGISIQGFISPTALTRSNRKDMNFFVNGRPVQDPHLAAALLKGYHTLLMVGRYPLAMLFIEITPEDVDVNVHPTKAEVRFREPDRIFSEVQRAVRRALLAHTPVPGLDAGLHWAPVETDAEPPEREAAAFHPGGPPFAPEPGTAQSGPAGGAGFPGGRAAGSDVIDQPPRWQAWNLTADEERLAAAGAPASAGPAAGPAPAQAPLPAPRIPLLRLVGHIASAYVVAEGPDGLYLVDQHAAHERVLFERFMAQHAAAGDSLPSQALLQPAAVELPAPRAQMLAGQIALLNRLGFQVEPFGPNGFLVRAVPLLLQKLDPAAALRVLVEDFEEDETPLQAEVEARLIARVCKRAAVKAGQTLSIDEQRALLQDLEACASPRTCPHGRPTMIHLSVDVLERQFGRKGAR